jgi:tetratricopeptide (TPR) repeat protein
LAWIYATHTDPAKRNALAAIELAEEANRLTQSQNPQILHTLAAAYAAGGRFQDATAVAGQALALASSSKNEALVRDISKRLQVYREYGSSSG